MITLRPIALAVFAFSSAAAAEERWPEYQACAERFLVNVERAEPSIWDGADLILRALCIQEGADVANDMVSGREMAKIEPFGTAFDRALAVIRRETAVKLYEARVLRLGLEEN